MILTPLIETVGSLVALNVPIVITGPPPLMVVEVAPAPARFKLLSIVRPPLYVPLAT